MNQLTVMLNGQPAATAGQHGGSQTTTAQQQYFTFQPSQPGSLQTIQTANMTLDPNTQQMVAFHTSPNAQQTLPNAVMLGAQNFQTSSGQAPGAIQYIISPQQPTNQQQTIQMASAPGSNTFGLMSNLITPGINMISVNQALPNSNGTPGAIIQPQMISTNGATIQPTQAFIQQPTGTFQIQATPQQSPTQFQVINPANNNGAIINSNQLIGAPNGQQFILNQTLTPANNPQSIYQLVLPNGQIIQTLQPPTTQLVPSSILSTPNQSPAITMPLQPSNNQVNPATILTPNIAFTNQTAGTSFVAQAAQPQISVNSTLQLTPTAQQTIMPTNNVFNNQSGTIMRENFINLNSMGNNAQTMAMAGMQTGLNSNNATSLTMPPTSIIVNHNSLQSPLNTTSTTTTTTTMMVLTPSNINDSSSLMSVSMLDQKSIKSINNKKENDHLNGCPMPSQIRLDNKGSASNKNKKLISLNLNGPKLINEFNEINNTNSSNDQTLPSNGSICTPNELNHKVDQLNEKIVNNINNNGDILSEKNISLNQQSLPRPSSVDSSNGSLKIAENDDDEDEGKNIDQRKEENNDNVSSGTEIDSTSLEYDGDLKMKDNDKNVHSTLESIEKKLNNKDEKEGYQSSYGGSPCHFTDTEDEEEEERSENGEMKLIRRNGLTQAAFNLINNRILSSEDDCATTVSVDSKCSSATSMLNEELCSINSEIKNKNNPLIDKISIQIQTSDTSSPANSLHSNDSQMEAESSTTQNTLISSKENTIWTPDEQKLVNEIQEFAKRFKLCRLSLGLTQEQVGRELYRLGLPYSQSAICRFEKLDITLKSARKIMPVLENWMRETEKKCLKNNEAGKIKPETVFINCITNKDNIASFKISSAFEYVNKNSPQNGLNGDESANSYVKGIIETNKKRKRRTSFTPAAIDALNKYFEDNNHPNGLEMKKISEKLNYDRDVVRVWFCNKRQATKMTKSKTDTDGTIHSPDIATLSPKSESNSSEKLQTSAINEISVNKLLPITTTANISSSTTIPANIYSTESLTPITYSPRLSINSTLTNVGKYFNPINTIQGTLMKTENIPTNIQSMATSGSLNVSTTVNNVLNKKQENLNSTCPKC